MAHNLNFRDGKASFFTVKEKAWHGLGKVLENCPTSAEAIKYAQLDYEVIKTPNLTLDKNNKPVEIEGSFSTKREDTGDILGCNIGEGYSILQNLEAFTFFDTIVGEGMAIYETAGALGKGETIFITAKLPGYIEVGNKDNIGKYLLLTNSHNGKRALQIMFTPIRVVCNNTLVAALKGKDDTVKIRHNSNMKERLMGAHKALAISNKLSDELQLIFSSMSKKRITDSKASEYFEKLLSKEQENEETENQEVANTDSKLSNKTIELVKEYYHIGVGQDLPTCRGTVFGAYNAVTGYFSNVKKYKNENNRMVGNYFGIGAIIMQKALEHAIEMVN